MDDVIRFNEAIDQALAESVAFYSAQVERARNLLLGMLGHDMRSPLQAIRMTALYLHDLNAGKEVGAAAARLIRSGARMQSLLDGLVDFNRTQLGLGMHVERRPCDLRDHLSGQLDELRAIYPERVFQLGIDGDCRGSWDGARVEQLVANLVINAIKYGAPGAPVRIAVTGREHEVAIDVANTGVPAEPDQLATLFEPLRRGGGSGSGADEGSLGLGLFIAREVARAHGGSIDARCDGTQTVFSVRLPKEVPQAA
jgi:signal transduction histidine kinase